MARRKEEGHGGHGWFVTFADLMGLLVSFFVMLVAFSNQDSKKVQAVRGSMRDAFGVQPEVRYSGIIETEGLFTREKLKNAAHIPPDLSSITPTRDEHGTNFSNDQAFALATVSLRQALQEFPELTEASNHIMIEEVKEGLNVELVDQDGTPMFPKGSAVPYEKTRVMIQKLAGPLKQTPFRVAITGHTAATPGAPRASPGQWELSLHRANAVRDILEEEGYPSANFYKVAGNADTDPLFPEDPAMASNRRITITLIREAPPIPMDLQP